MAVDDRPRAIRVFISSTFRDMQAEREELVKQVFPELRRRCEARGVSWSEVDLRWGVTDEEKAEGAVLPICLAEIEHSRPYFIGLVGDRYGWVPDEIPTDLREQEAWLADVDGKSVTEMEILHGVLNDPSMADHAFFYLRDPAWVRSRPSDEQAVYLESATEDEIAALGPAAAEERAAARRRQLADLKDRIRASGYPVHDGYPDPVALGPMVLDDLGRLVDELFPADAPADPLDRAAAEQSAFAQARFGLYVGGAAGMAALDAHLAAGGPPLLVTGPDGIGKSALLAQWAASVAGAASGDGGHLVVTHHVAASADSADWDAMLRRLIGELGRGTGVTEPAPLPADPDGLKAAFADALRVAAAERPVVLVVDGLDELADRDFAPDLPWLPWELPPGVCFVGSASGQRTREAAHARHWIEHEVVPLTPDERRDLIGRVLAVASKRLGPELTDRLAGDDRCGNPLFLRTVVDELRQHGDHFTLGDVIDGYLAAPDLPGLFERVTARWERDFERERPGLVGDALRLLWASRRGLAEAELLDLLSTTGRPLPNAVWSPLFLAAGQSLTVRSGLVAFLHEPLRAAVARRWLADDDTRRATHHQLADYFARRELSPRVVAELPWQLRQAGDWPELSRVLTGPELLAAAYRADLPDLRSSWAAVEAGGGPDMVEAYRPVLDDPAAHATIAWEVARLLTDAGHPSEALALHQFLVDDARGRSDPRRLAGSLLNLAAAHLGRDELDAADSALTEAETVARGLGDDRILQAVLGNEGSALRARGQFDAALAKMAEEEAICRRLGDLIGLQASVGNQGAVLRDRRSLDPALEKFAEQERIARQIGDPTLVNKALAAEAQVLADRGEVEAALTLLGRQEAECREHGDLAALAANLGNRAAILQQQGRLDEAEATAREEADLAERLGSHATLARSLFLQATIAHQRGDGAAATELLDRHQAIAEHLGDRAALAIGLGERGTIVREGGQPAAALAIHATEEELYRGLGDTTGLATSFGNQALAHRALGDLGQAVALQGRSEALIRQVGVPAMLQNSLGNKAAFLLEAGDVAGAATALAEQERICREIGHRAGLAACLGNQAVVAMQQGDAAVATAHLAEQERICREVGDRPSLVTCLGNQTAMAVQGNDGQGAIRLADSWLAEARQLGPAGTMAVIDNLNLQSKLRPAMGDTAGLARIAGDVTTDARASGNQALLAHGLAIQGSLAIQSGPAALPMLTEAESAARAANNPYALQLALGAQGVLAMQAGRHADAEARFREQAAICAANAIPDGRSSALGNLAVVLQHQGDSQAALTALTEQEALCRQMNDAQNLVLCLANRGEVTAQLPGRRAEGLGVLDQAAALAQQVGWAPMAAQIQQLRAQLAARPGS